MEQGATDPSSWGRVSLSPSWPYEPSALPFSVSSGGAIGGSSLVLSCLCSLLPRHPAVCLLTLPFTSSPAGLSSGCVTNLPF